MNIEVAWIRYSSVYVKKKKKHTKSKKLKIVKQAEG